MPVQFHQIGKHIGGRGAGRAKILLGHSGSLQPVFMSLLLCFVENRQKPPAVIGSIVRIGSEFGFYFHISVLSVAVKDEFEQRKTALVVYDFIVFIANKFGVELIEYGGEQ